MPKKGYCLNKKRFFLLFKAKTSKKGLIFPAKKGILILQSAVWHFFV